MRINEYRRAVYNALLSSAVEDSTDNLILSCILYDYVKKIVENERSLANNVRDLAQNYLPGFKRNLESFKTSFISYDTMRKTIESLQKDSFLNFNENDINSIVSLYRDRTQVISFSSNYFSQYMYRVLVANDYQYKRLSSIHFSVMVPIIKFYVSNNGMSDSDMEVFSATNYLENPGKEILFRIRGLAPSKVVNDVKTFRIPIKENRDFYSIEVYKDFVKIMNN